jgi:hypothetical protein
VNRDESVISGRLPERGGEPQIFESAQLVRFEGDERDVLAGDRFSERLKHPRLGFAFQCCGQGKPADLEDGESSGVVVGELGVGVGIDPRGQFVCLDHPVGTRHLDGRIGRNKRLEASGVDDECTIGLGPGL